MQLNELLKLDVFKHAKILTGDIGLTNRVASAMVLEAIDIEKWSKKEQIILTSFYAFEGISSDELQNFFRKMQEIGISGLVVKMDRLIKMIPEWLIDLCYQYEIPLIKIKQQIGYEAIMLAIYEPLLNSQSHLLRTYYDVRQKFTKIGRSPSSFEQIIREFYQMIEKPCHLRIPELNIDINFGKNYSNYLVVQREELASIDFTKNRYECLHLISQSSGDSVIAIEVDIVNTYTEQCALTVFQKEEEIKESIAMIFENAVDVIYERLQMEYLLKKERSTHLNNLADAILQNTTSNLNELNSLLSEVRLNQYPYYQTITFISLNQNEKFITKIRNQFRGIRANVLFFEHRRYITLLYNLKDETYFITKKELSVIWSKEFCEKNKLIIAISNVKKINELNEILAECLNTIKFGRHFSLYHIIDYHELGFFQPFIENNQLDQLEKMIPEKLLSLYQSNFELYQTLFTFYQQNRNYQRTAEILFLHPKTIRYRLNKIEALLEIDLNNPIHLLNYEFAVYLLKLSKGALNID